MQFKNLFYGMKAKQYKREWLSYSPSTGSVYCFFSKHLATKSSTYLADKDGFSDWRNNIIIDNHRQNANHRDSMLTYLSRRHDLGLLQKAISVTINSERMHS